MIWLKAQFECDYCGRTAFVHSPPGQQHVSAPGPWLMLFGQYAGHFCDLPCAWWAVHKAKPGDDVFVVGDTYTYGPTMPDWKQPPDPRAGQ